MRKWWIVLILLVVVIFTQTVQGQEADLVCINYQTNVPGSGFDGEYPQGYFDNYFSALNTQLSAYSFIGIATSKSTSEGMNEFSNDCDQALKLELSFSASRGNAVIFVSVVGGESETQITKQLLMVSRIFDFEPLYPLVNPFPSADEAALSTVFLILYYAARCQEVIDLVDSATSFELAAFYAGKCAVAIGEIGVAIESFTEAKTFAPYFDLTDQVNIYRAWLAAKIKDQEVFGKVMDWLSAEILSRYDQIEEQPAILSELIYFLTKRAQLHYANRDSANALNDINAAIELNPENAELYVIRGEVRGYNRDESIEDYNIAIELNPEYSDPYFLRGEMMYRHENFESAVADFYHYLELAPNGIYADRARILYMTQRGEEEPLPPGIETVIPMYFDENIESIYSIKEHLLAYEIGVQEVDNREKAMVVITFDAGVYAPVAYIISVTENADINLLQSPILIEQFDDYVSFNSNAEAHGLYTTGIVLYALGRCNEALSIFEQFPTEVDVNNYQPLYMSAYSMDFYSGVCALQAEEYTVAEALFKAVEYNNPQYRPVESIVNSAWLRQYAGFPDEAIEILTNDINFAHSEETLYWSEEFRNLRLTTVLSSRAQLHALNFDFDSAITDINTAIGLDPQNPELYVTRGQIRMLLYEWDGVMDDYNTALELDPDYADAYYYRGLLNYTVAGVGNSDVNALRNAAIADFERYLDLAPDGLHAGDAAQYIEQIQAELEALER